MNEKIFYLLDHPYFAGLDQKSQVDLVKSVDVFSLGAFSKLYDYGKPANSAFYILEGSVILYWPDEAQVNHKFGFEQNGSHSPELIKNAFAKNRIHYEIKESGTLLSPQALLIQTQRQSSALAYEETTIASISRTNYQNILKNNPNLAAELLEIYKIKALKAITDIDINLKKASGA